MDNLINSKKFHLILLLTIIGEFLVPWILKHFFEGYDSSAMVMSVLGGTESPVRRIYNLWLIWLGIFLLITAVMIFNDFRKTSFVLALLSLLSIGIFAIGAGILSGIFSVNNTKDFTTLAEQIHGYGAPIGFMALLFFPLFNGIIAMKRQDTLEGIVCIIAFILALVLFTCFIMGDKEQFQNTIIAKEGLWERLSLMAMYIPFVYRAMEKLLK